MGPMHLAVINNLVNERGYFHDRYRHCWMKRFSRLSRSMCYKEMKNIVRGYEHNLEKLLIKYLM